ncbi:MAG TPA: hypothetical protein DCR14_03780 [Acidimicrobiaceae bacterium]|nr:hypothetical protein [Acidimicrobiaceae bacterium]
MSAPRVVITGMGWVTPLGHDVPTAWAALIEGRSGMGRITRFDAASFKTDFAAEVKDYDLSRHLPAAADHVDSGLNTRFALGAAAQAVGLLFDDGGGMALGSDAHCVGQLHDLCVGHAELFGELVHPDVLRQTLVSLSVALVPVGGTHRQAILPCW